MKIVAGLGSIDEYERFVKAGADEFFCGYVPYSWSKKYGTVLPLNRREVLCYNVQLGAFEELRILAAMIKKYGKPVHLTFNSLYYIPEQYPEIAEIIRCCMTIGFHSYIIADPALMVYLRENNVDCDLHISGETGEINRRMVDAVAQFHPKRLIFHRKNTFEDMESVIKSCKNKQQNLLSKQMYEAGKEAEICEFEAFVLNELCQFTGAFCNSLHCDEMGYLCRVPYWKKPMSLSESKLEKQEKNHPGENISISEWDSASELTNPVSEDGYLCGATGCGLCTLKQLSDTGITHLKLVGRGNYTDFMERDIRNLRRTLEILEDSSTEEEYIRAMKAELFPNGCSHMCYAR